MFSSDWPTYLLITSGPLRSSASSLSIFPICRAMASCRAGRAVQQHALDVVDAQPLHDGLREHAAGEGLAEDVSNCLSSPLMPLNEKSFVLNSCELTEEDFLAAILIAEACAASKKRRLGGHDAAAEVTLSATPSTSMELNVTR